MKRRGETLHLLVGALLVLGLPMASVGAQEESASMIPTLLIKGEVVSVDANDPTAILLTVKDRYGFETPIYLTDQTRIVRGERVLTPSDLTAQTSVEVEYTFDINTAKRQAISVTVSESEALQTQPSSGFPPTDASTQAVTPDAAVPATPGATTPAPLTPPPTQDPEPVVTPDAVEEVPAQ